MSAQPPDRDADLWRNFSGIAADIGAALDRIGAAEPVQARLQTAALRDSRR